MSTRENIRLIARTPFSDGFNLCKTLHMRSFVKKKASQNGEITMSYTKGRTISHPWNLVSFLSALWLPDSYVV